jgi:hypothetical protein
MCRLMVKQLRGYCLQKYITEYSIMKLMSHSSIKTVTCSTHAHIKNSHTKAIGQCAHTLQ